MFLKLSFKIYNYWFKDDQLHLIKYDTMVTRCQKILHFFFLYKHKNKDYFCTRINMKKHIKFNI